MIRSCIMRARRDVISVTHVHPDYAVPVSVFEKELKPMAQEGAALVSKPIPVLPQMKIIFNRRGRRSGSETAEVK